MPQSQLNNFKKQILFNLGALKLTLALFNSYKEIPQKKTIPGLQEILFFLLLVSTVLPPTFLWASRIAWVVLAIFCAKNIEYSLCALFFYASFFTESGFGKGLFFTLKHFHISIFITTLTHLIIHTQFRTTVKKGVNNFIRFWIPLLAVFIIGILPIRSQGLSASTWILFGNLLLTIFSFYYIHALMSVTKPQLAKLLTYFLIGTCFVVLYGAYRDYFLYDINNLYILHNKHLSVELAAAIFISLGLVLLNRNLYYRVFYVTLFSILFTAVIFTCGRTAWLSILVTLIPFAIFQLKYNPSRTISKKIGFTPFFFLFLSLGIIYAVAYKSPLILERHKQIPQLWSSTHWKHTLSDQQNFGFFGIFRLQQTYDLWATLETNPLWGQGFSRETMGYHGLYFSALGSGGICGLLFLVRFIQVILNGTIETLRKETNITEFQLGLASLCAFIAWLLCSFMQTLILQFSVWIPIVCCIHFASRSTQDKDSHA